MKRLVLFVINLVLLTSSVCFAKGWVQEGAKWKYQDSNGEFLEDTQKVIDGQWYTFDASGYMATGLYEDENGKFYYFNDDGTPVNGSIIHKGKSYSITNKGEIKGITEKEFIEYRDTLSQQYILGGAHNLQLQGVLDTALNEAKSYFDNLPLSRRAFRLIYAQKGFNKDAIDNEIATAKINWKEQALKCAQEYYDKSQLERKDMMAILTAEEFLDNEASYGTEMAFKNDTFSTGIGKKTAGELMSQYLDRMFMLVFGKTYTELSIVNREVANAAAANEIDSAANANKYYIVKKTKRTYSVSIEDDDSETGKISVKVTVPVPELGGPNAAGLNATIEAKLFGAIRDVLEETFYDEIYRSRKYSANEVTIASQDATDLVLQFIGDYTVMVHVDLNSMTFK